MMPPLRFEARIALAVLRRIGMHPSRRALWFIAGMLAAVAIAVDIATSDVASRDLGALSPSPLLVIGVAAGILALAAFVGSRTPLTYGTRAADAIWWRYAGVDAGTGQRATTAILTVRVMLGFAVGGTPIAALLALAAPQRAGTIVALAIVMALLAPATVLVSSACAPRRITGGRHGTADDSAAGVLPVTSDPLAKQSSRTNIPLGLTAARWLVARRRGETLVPYDRFAYGLVAGVVAPRVAALAGGQLVAMGIVVGGLAVIFDAAIRGTTAPSTFRSPWWRAAVGTSPVALAAWAFCDAAGVAATLIGVALALGFVLGDLLPAFAAIPAIVLVPAALRLVVLAVDTVFPAAADRFGPGVSARVAVVGGITAGTFALALVAGARGGPLASIAVTTAVLLAVVVVAAYCSSVRLPAAIG
ncbi:MAG: hypothetical protein M3169_09185 [Candidatus Eremiobacteraeota bacterium]|nr:hypothetical protein [Candidatus Eremiobacteraeota bacterium]